MRQRDLLEAGLAGKSGGGEEDVTDLSCIQQVHVRWDSCRDQEEREGTEGGWNG